MHYYIWTIGCQMNVADSHRVASALERLGYTAAARPEEADVVVLNTCAVRQSAEDKAYGRLMSLKPLKKKRPHMVINMMGCVVGLKGHDRLKQRFPFVDVFSPPSDPAPLLSYLTQREHKALQEAETRRRFALQDGELVLPRALRGRLVSEHVPVVLGCSHACTYCVIPYRRGVERSRPPEIILAEVRSLAVQGVKEITLLGQIVDRYGKDLDGVDLAWLLRKVHEIEGVERIRFLTSHPLWMTDELLETVAALPKVMPHIEVPVQAGDDEVLAAMRRGYTAENYRRLVAKIRATIPEVAIATDVIVGFPGESETQFRRTYDLLEELRLDVVHLARYSERPGTLAARKLLDDVPAEEKMRRFRLIEALQERISAEINSRYLGEKVPVLFEEKVRGRWRGRTPTNKLVFVDSERDLRGKIEEVLITWTGPWSLLGRLAEVKQPALQRVNGAG